MICKLCPCLVRGIIAVFAHVQTISSHPDSQCEWTHTLKEQQIPRHALHGSDEQFSQLLLGVRHALLGCLSIAQLQQHINNGKQESTL